MYGETVKPQYEVALKQNVKGDVDNDYETVDFIGADNYKEACKIAKAQSKDIGINNNDGRFQETERLNAGLAMVTVCCYYADNTSDYNEVWQEDYVGGKKVGRYIL